MWSRWRRLPGQRTCLTTCRLVPVSDASRSGTPSLEKWCVTYANTTPALELLPGTVIYWPLVVAIATSTCRTSACSVIQEAAIMVTPAVAVARVVTTAAVTVSAAEVAVAAITHRHLRRFCPRLLGRPQVVLRLRPPLPFRWVLRQPCLVAISTKGREEVKEEFEKNAATAFIVHKQMRCPWTMSSTPVTTPPLAPQATAHCLVDPYRCRRPWSTVPPVRSTVAAIIAILPAQATTQHYSLRQVHGNRRCVVSLHLRHRCSVHMLRQVGLFMFLGTCTFVFIPLHTVDRRALCITPAS